MNALLDQAVARLGRLDCIVNNAGWHPPAMSIDQISVDDFEKLVRLNLTSTFMGCKFALPHLERTRGSIINMTSAVALIGQAAAVSYVATKGGQIGLTRALAVDLAQRNPRQCRRACRCDDPARAGNGPKANTTRPRPSNRFTAGTSWAAWPRARKSAKSARSSPAMKPPSSPGK